MLWEVVDIKYSPQDAKSQFNHAFCYLNGYGVPEDKAKAANWYRKAAEQGHEEAAEALKRLSE